MYTRRTCSALQVQYLQETNAKLGGVVLYGDIHPNCNVQSVTCENCRKTTAQRSRSLLKTGDHAHKRRISCRAFVENLRSWVVLCLMDIFILELVSNQLTVPVKIDGRQEQAGRNIGAIEKQGSMYNYIYTHVGHACAGILVQYLAKLSWVSWCFMKTLIIVMSNLFKPHL